MFILHILMTCFDCLCRLELFVVCLGVVFCCQTLPAPVLADGQEGKIVNETFFLTVPIFSRGDLITGNVLGTGWCRIYLHKNLRFLSDGRTKVERIKKAPSRMTGPQYQLENDPR
jgi:hypothetical protein